MWGVISHMSLPDASWHHGAQRKALSIFMPLPTTHTCAHTHLLPPPPAPPPVCSRQCAPSRWLSRHSKSTLQMGLKMAPFRMPRDPAAALSLGICEEMPCTQHSVLRNNSSCAGQLCPLPSLFRVGALDLSLPEPLILLKFGEENICMTWQHMATRWCQRSVKDFPPFFCGHLNL